MMKQTVDEFNRAKSYEIIVRMADGLSRVFNDANPARWRSGERVIVIDGADPSNR